MTLEKLLKNVKITHVQGNIEAKVSGIAFNSAQVKPGDVFVCIPGFKTDGHDYAADALEKGAIALVVEHPINEDTAATIITVENARYALSQMAAEFYDHPYKKFNLVGITGTNGKTTTTYLLKRILESCGQKVGLIGTNQNMIGDEVLPSSHTTPDSLELMVLFDRMAKENVETVVMEVSSHSLALDRVAACKFCVGAFTNVTQDHLDFHETMDNYIEAKSMLFGMCREAVLNVDDGAAERMEKAATGEIIRYSAKGQTDLYAKNISYKPDGVEFDMVYGGRCAHIELGIPGRFSVCNALTAAGCALGLGIGLQQIAKGLKNAPGVKGRIEVVKSKTDFTVIIDYAHTPDGLENILRSIRDFASKRIITLFGCGGDRDKTKRPQMGKIAGELSDFCVVTSDNPRSEEPGMIIEDILVGMKETDCEYKVIENRFEAIEFALDSAEPGDIILLAGKGHETYQVLNDRTIVFDEREIVHKLVDDSDSLGN